MSCFGVGGPHTDFYIAFAFVGLWKKHEKMELWMGNGVSRTGVKWIGLLPFGLLVHDLVLRWMVKWTVAWIYSCPFLLCKYEGGMNFG